LNIELRRPDAADLPELGRICYEAFRDISESHGFPTDFATVDFATGVIGLMMSQEQVYASAAYAGGRPRGSNYINMWGDVAGIGPISVDLDAQGEGIGRQLMLDVIAHARAQGFEMIRLVQDSFNMRSLALYSSLGFDVKEPLAYLALAPGGRTGDALRPAAPGDLDGMDALCNEVYGITRKNECGVMLQLGFPAFVLDRGHIAGYLIGGAIGHGVAESDDDMLALLGGAGASAQGVMSLLPIREGELYRRALADGHRNVKVMNLMAIGPCEEPEGYWLPSVISG
jgi:ribosomal protein S18 acetylase RimI-like enzyme